MASPQPARELMNPFPTLPPRVAQEVLAQLFSALPPPHDDGPQARKDRDALAVATLAALRPVDVTEAMLAVQIVLSEAFSRDCLREANRHRTDIKLALKCRTQAAALMRRMHRDLRTLLARQAARPADAVAPVAAPAPVRASGNVVVLPVNRARRAAAPARQSDGGGADIVCLFDTVMKK